MKPDFFHKNSPNASRSIGQAVASLVMAAAITLGGAGTTFLLASQPTGLAVEPATLQWENRDTLSGSEQEPISSVIEAPAASQELPVLTQPGASAEESVSVTETAPESPSVERPGEQSAARPEIPPLDPIIGAAVELEEENSLPHFQPETDALAAEDPLADPETDVIQPEAAAPGTAAENGEDALKRAQLKDVNGMVLLTPEEIRAALDAGTLDEESIDPNCLGEENGLLRWLWDVLFGWMAEKPQYSGWKTINNKTYYYDPETNQPLTGIQSIENKLYYFDANGVQRPATFGIDVSKYQSDINWKKVKAAGVQFAVVRVGYRGYSTGALVMDPRFEEHFTNARNAGLRLGVYCFSQAVNEEEAREEARACITALNGRMLEYPIYFDTEASGSGNGRADGLGVEDRTKCAIAFCEEVKAQGYKPGVYASTLWFRKRVDLNRLAGYSIWNAHYGVASSPIPCDLWQGTCSARISGYNGQLDVNISYVG